MLVTQLCLTLCDSIYCSPPGSSVHGILQARILEWVAKPSKGSSQWILYHWTIREVQALSMGIEIISLLLMRLLALLCSTVYWTLLSRSHMVYSNTFFKKSFTMEISFFQLIFNVTVKFCLLHMFSPCIYYLILWVI